MSPAPDEVKSEVKLVTPAFVAGTLVHSPEPAVPLYTHQSPTFQKLGGVPKSLGLAKPWTVHMYNIPSPCVPVTVKSGKPPAVEKVTWTPEAIDTDVFTTTSVWLVTEDIKTVVPGLIPVPVTLMPTTSVWVGAVVSVIVVLLIGALVVPIVPASHTPS